MTARKSRQETVSAADFRAHCLALLEKVSADGREVTVKKRDKAVARLVPPTASSRPLRRAHFKHLIEFVGDIESPLDGWKAEK